MAPRFPKEVVSSINEFYRADWPFYWIARVNALYTHEMERVLRVVDSDISTWRVLAILQEQGISSMSDIAVHSVAKLSTTTKIVYRMKADGLVTTSASREDGRVTLVDLTPAGHQQLQRVADASHGLFQRSFDGLTPARVVKLNELLRQIFRNLHGGDHPILDDVSVAPVKASRSGSEPVDACAPTREQADLAAAQRSTAVSPNGKRTVHRRT